MQQTTSTLLYSYKNFAYLNILHGSDGFIFLYFIPFSFYNYSTIAYSACTAMHSTFIHINNPVARKGDVTKGAARDQESTHTINRISNIGEGVKLLLNKNINLYEFWKIKR